MERDNICQILEVYEGNQDFFLFFTPFYILILLIDHFRKEKIRITPELSRLSELPPKSENQTSFTLKLLIPDKLPPSTQSRAVLSYVTYAWQSSQHFIYKKMWDPPVILLSLFLSLLSLSSSHFIAGRHRRGTQRLRRRATRRRWRPRPRRTGTPQRGDGWRRVRVAARDAETEAATTTSSRPLGAETDRGSGGGGRGSGGAAGGTDERRRWRRTMRARPCWWPPPRAHRHATPPRRAPTRTPPSPAAR